MDSFCKLTLLSFFCSLSKQGLRLTLVHYLHQLWPEDFVCEPVVDVLHVKHEASNVAGNAFMVVRKGEGEGATEQLRSAGLTDIERGCLDDETRSRSLLDRARSISASTQMERFLYLSLHDYASFYAHSSTSSSSSPSADDPDASEGSTHDEAKAMDPSTASPDPSPSGLSSPQAFLNDDYVASGGYAADLAGNDGVATEKYRRLVYEPAFASSRKILHPPLRSWDDSFQGFIRLLNKSARHYEMQGPLKSDPPTFWVLVYWSLCYRSVGREDFFLRWRKQGRLPLPRASELDILTQSLHKGAFTARYRVQGASKINATLHQFLRWKTDFATFNKWEHLCPGGLTPRLLHSKLTTLDGISHFMSWQVDHFILFYLIRFYSILFFRSLHRS